MAGSESRRRRRKHEQRAEARAKRELKALGKGIPPPTGDSKIAWDKYLHKIGLGATKYDKATGPMRKARNAYK